MKHRLKRILTIMLAIAAVFTVTLSATADNLRNLQDRRQGVLDDIRIMREQVEAFRAERDDVSAEIILMDIELMEIAFAQEEAAENLALTTAMLDEAEADLSRAEELRQAQVETLRTRIRFMHENNSISYIELLFSSNSIADFLRNMEHITRIIEHDNNILTELQETENRITENRDAIARHLDEIVLLTLELEQAANDLQAAIDARAARLMELDAEDEYVRNMIVALEQSERELFRNITDEQARQTAIVAERNRLAATNVAHAVTQRAGALFVWPVDGSRVVNSGYGYRPSPIRRGVTEFHTGLDLRAPMNTPILAAADGVVTFQGWRGGFGNTVIIYHGNGLETWYAHNTRNTVVVGQRVVAGERIALAGTTGQSTGPHLHFEVRLNGRHVDPRPYLGID